MYRCMLSKDGKVVLVAEQEDFDDPTVWSGDPELIRKVKACGADGYCPTPIPPDMFRCSNFYSLHRNEGYTIDYQNPWINGPLPPSEPGVQY